MTEDKYKVLACTCSLRGSEDTTCGRVAAHDEMIAENLSLADVQQLNMQEIRSGKWSAVWFINQDWELPFPVDDVPYEINKAIDEPEVF